MRKEKTKIVLAYLAIYLIWGTTYLAVLWGLEGMGPFILSAFRYLIAGAILLTWAFFQNYKWPSINAARPAIISGCIMLVGGSGLIALAETYINSGHAAVIIATEPLWFLVLDRKRWREYLRKPLICSGIAMGFIGITIFSFADKETQLHADNKNLAGTMIAVVGSIAWVIGALYADRRPQLRDYPHFLVTGIQLLAAGAVSTLIAFSLGEWNAFVFQDVTAKAWTGLIFLIFMGSIVAYGAFMWLMKIEPPALVSTHTYVNPIVALFAGWLLANEEITGLQGLALLLVLGGVIIAQKSRNTFT